MLIDVDNVGHGTWNMEDGVWKYHHALRITTHCPGLDGVPRAMHNTRSVHSFTVRRRPLYWEVFSSDYESVVKVLCHTKPLGGKVSKRSHVAEHVPIHLVWGFLLHRVFIE